MKKYSLIATTILLVVLFLRLSYNYSERFQATEHQYLEKNAVNLTADTSPNSLSRVLNSCGYVPDKDDADFVSNYIIEKLKDGQSLSSLSDLNKRVWQMPISLIDSLGSSTYKSIANGSRESIGIDSEFKSIDIATLQDRVIVNPNMSGKINVAVSQKTEGSNRFSSQVSPCSNVIVRLSEQYVDTLSKNDFKSERQTIAYLITNDEGEGCFEGLDPNLSYSVLPIAEGYEYGVPKGTIGGPLSYASRAQRSVVDKIFGLDKNAITCSFTQYEHTIRIFNAQTLKQIKADQTLTIRSPRDFKRILVEYVVKFFVAWWGFWFWERRRKVQPNSTIISILMCLTGLSLLAMFSFNDPLTDRLLGPDVAQGIIIGVVLIALVQNVNFKKLYQNQLPIGFDVPRECVKWIFKPFRLKVRYLTEILSSRSSNVIIKSVALLLVVICLPTLVLDLFKITSLHHSISQRLDTLPKGNSYLIAALILTALLFTPLGVAVGGMKVNLNLGVMLFQPSEIAKYLIVFFMASYFSANANKIVQYSEKGNSNLFVAKLKSLAIIILGLGTLMMLYLVLGDMGPSLVLAFTFIILYSAIKSKIDLAGVASDSVQLKKIMTCDIAMLTYGVLSFVGFLCFGHLLGNMGILCLLWFLMWIAVGISKRQIYETPILFNFIVAIFIFGGQIFSDVPGLASVGNRLSSRNEMCFNTWGTLPINGNIADAGENTQVAEGLWGLASGGLWGQGLGNGFPHFIPAFHTDMVLESIGEQMGFVCLALILALLAILLRKAVVIGYRTSHPFTFYLCTGIAIVTAVQFIVISLGSVGIIPLTGVTAPFLSYGKVSMILNLAAYGIILAIDSNSRSEIQPIQEKFIRLAKENIFKYNYTVSLLSWVCSIFLVLVGVTFFYYQLFDRKDTLIRPVYVHNSYGHPIIEYNPRIGLLTQAMRPGDIYDRNGVLLATSDPSKFSANFDASIKSVQAHTGGNKKMLNAKLDIDTLKHLDRYYPFKEHLYFMLGDLNSKLYASSDADAIYPKGYMAEFKHISDLRGYDNKLRDENNELVQVDLFSEEYAPSQYLSNRYTIFCDNIQLRDYTALVPYLKAGINSRAVEDVNNRKEGQVEPKDVQLTIDAFLQVELQQAIDSYVKNRHAHLNKLRVSVVIIDAQRGDLLTSAVYPLPNYDTLKQKDQTYNDMNVSPQWKAYTDMDLGLIYPTSPGSTAKIITGLAGYRKEGDNIERARYYVDPKEKIFNRETAGWNDISLAYIKSSNCYFVHLLNDRDLFYDLADIYGALGISINGRRPYVFSYCEPTSEWLSLVTSARDKCIYEYARYKDSGRKEKMNNTTGKPDEWSWAWGQNGMDATPLAMARAISLVANNGAMPITRFTLQEPIRQVEILASTNNLKKHLKDTRRTHERAHSFSKREDIGGKTGTPERVNKTNRKRIKNSDNTYKTITNAVSKANDGWYVCFIEDATVKAKILNLRPKEQAKENSMQTAKVPLAIAIRMERLGEGEMSGNATRLMDNVVIPVLKKCEYIH